MRAVATNEQSTDMRDRPLGEVARDLTRDVSLLVRQEVELAKAEMAQKGRVAAPGLGMIGGAGVAGLMAAGALTAFLILVLSIFLPECLNHRDAAERSLQVRLKTTVDIPAETTHLPDWAT